MSSTPTPPAAPSEVDVRAMVATLRCAEVTHNCGGVPMASVLIGSCRDAATMLCALLAANARLKRALDIATEYFEDRSDVVDGDYGEPKPNICMQVMHDINYALSPHNEAGK